MKIITVGGRFLDIDGLGAGVAYAELLSRQGSPAKFVCTGTLNESITKTIRGWDLPIETTYRRSDDDRFVVVDNSAPDFLEKFIQTDQLEEIIDHHLGKETYWKDLGVKTDIEFVGACCTQIFERWARSGRLHEISQVSARLLMTGILDNTLYFQATVTTKRDKRAYDILRTYAGLPDDWPEQYFAECQRSIEQDVEKALQNDTKQALQYPGFDASVAVSQLAVWHGEALLARQDELLRLTEQYGDIRAVHILSIAENKSYFISRHEPLRHFFAALLDVTFVGDVAVSNRLWLRKEIMKASIEKEKSGE